MELEQSDATLEFNHLKFHGQAGDYFKIWIVNLLLTLITFGIYSPWAKIRKMKYMNQATEFKGSRMDYHAEPIPILIGRAIAAVLFGLYFWGGQINWFIGIFGFLTLFFALPFLFVKSLRFKTKNTSYRNIRFGFRGKIDEAYQIWFRFFAFYFVLGLIALLSIKIFGALPDRSDKAATELLWKHPTFLIQIGIGLINLIYTIKMAPHALSAIYNYIYNNLYYGAAKVSITADPKSVSQKITGPYFSAIGMLVLGLIGFIFAIVFMAAKVKMLLFLIFPMVLGIYAGLFYVSILFPYLTNIFVWNRLSVSNYQSRIVLSKKAFMSTVFLNLLAIGVSFGLLIPWTQIRYRRLLTEAKAFNIDNMDQFAEASSPTTSPFADEMVDVFDVDFEIGL